MNPKREDLMFMGAMIAIVLAFLTLFFDIPALGVALGVIGVVLFWNGVKEHQEVEAAERRVAKRREEEVLRQERQREEAERLRCEWRDADTQDTPYEYECAGHPSRTLALRYGIANDSAEWEPITVNEHYKKIPRMDPATGRWPASRIKLRKLQKVYADEEGAHYLAELPTFGDRLVRVVIKPGTEFVKTFYPMSEDWFKEHANLEMILKDNPTFSLKELATFHVQAVLNAKLG